MKPIVIAVFAIIACSCQHSATPVIVLKDSYRLETKRWVQCWKSCGKAQRLLVVDEKGCYCVGEKFIALPDPKYRQVKIEPEVKSASDSEGLEISTPNLWQMLLEVVKGNQS